MISLSKVCEPKRFPNDDAGNAWYNILPELPAPNRLNGDEAADYAIIGAGICGVSFARRLAELRPNDRIVILDATRAGYGASGRNAGFMLNHNTHGEIKSLDVERRNSLLCSAGHGLLKRQVQENGIDCWWSDWGRLYVAISKEGDDHLTELQENYVKLNLGSEILDAASMQELLGTDVYCRGLKTSGNGLVNPAALMRGLAYTLPDNVSLYENTPVEKIISGKPHQLETAHGTVQAKNLVLANSVFFEDLHSSMGRIVPLATFGSLTKPLTNEQLGQFGTAEEFALLPAHPNGSTVRLTPDKRLLMRNVVRYSVEKSFSNKELLDIGDTHRFSIEKRWPGLADVEFEGTWGGMLGYTRNDGTIWGELGDKIYAVISSDASPMTRGAMSATLLAEKICGVRNELLPVMESLPLAGILPPNLILKPMVNRTIHTMEASGFSEL